MARVAATLLLLVISGVTSQTPCGDGQLVEVGEGSTDERGWWISVNGNRFPPGCSWKWFTDVRMGCQGRSKPCLWKCCGLGETMGAGNNCMNTTDPLRKTFLPKPRGEFDSIRFELLFVTPCMNQSYEIETEDDNYPVFDNGTLKVLLPLEDKYRLLPTYDEPKTSLPTYEAHDAGNWCYDTRGDVKVYRACYDTKDVGHRTTRRGGVKFIINATGMLISLPFLLATLVVYAAVPELRNLHGKCLISHVTCLIVGFTWLIVFQLGNLPPRELPKLVCTASGYFAYFFMLASFIWLQVMSFDIWWTFSGFSSYVGVRNSQDNRKFIFYSLYAWGVAVVALCICLGVQFSPGIPDRYPKPSFGEQSCWFNESKSQWLYFNGPVALLIAFNIVFFIHTAMCILKAQRQTSLLRRTPDTQISSQQDDKLRFKLYLKLFIIMGVSWSMEIISTAIGGREEIWYVTDLLNVLVGIPIFIVFVCQSKARRLFMDKMNSNLHVRKMTSTTGLEFSTR